MSVVFLFLDGVGIAPAGPDNPLSWVAMPQLEGLLGGRLIASTLRPELTEGRGRVLLRPIDATLGVEGLPQSGTGQTALFAGFNAAQLHGRHQPHFPPVDLRPRLAAENIFQRALSRGQQPTFANAFGPGYWEALAARKLRRSASVIAAEGAGLRFRDLDDLWQGTAISWDITGERMRGRPTEWPVRAAAVVGEQLARLADHHELVLFECFLTDLVGHGRLNDPEAGADSTTAVTQVLTTIDQFLGGVMAGLRPHDSLLLCSDHGNVESFAATHTRNPVPLLVVGPAVPYFATVTAIDQVADALDLALSVTDQAGHGPA